MLSSLKDSFRELRNYEHCEGEERYENISMFLVSFFFLHICRFYVFIAEESRTHTVLCDKYQHLRQIKCLQYLILLRIFSLHLQNICSLKTAKHPPALKFLMDLVKAS